MKTIARNFRVIMARLGIGTMPPRRGRPKGSKNKPHRIAPERAFVCFDPLTMEVTGNYLSLHSARIAAAHLKRRGRIVKAAPRHEYRSEKSDRLVIADRLRRAAESVTLPARVDIPAQPAIIVP